MAGLRPRSFGVRRPGVAPASGWTVLRQIVLWRDGSVALVPKGAPKGAGQSPIKSAPSAGSVSWCR